MAGLGASPEDSPGKINWERVLSQAIPAEALTSQRLRPRLPSRATVLRRVQEAGVSASAAEAADLVWLGRLTLDLMVSVLGVAGGFLKPKIKFVSGNVATFSDAYPRLRPGAPATQATVLAYAGLCLLYGDLKDLFALGWRMFLASYVEEDVMSEAEAYTPR